MKFSFAFFCAPLLSRCWLITFLGQSTFSPHSRWIGHWRLRGRRPVQFWFKKQQKETKSTTIFKIKHKVVRTRRGFRIISVVIWVGSIALSLPEIIYSKVEHDEWNITICHMTFPVATNETGHETEARRVQVFFFWHHQMLCLINI